LRHPERVATDIFIDDQIADHHNLQRGKSLNDLQQVIEREIMPVRVIGRLEDCREICFIKFPSKKVERREPCFAGTEKKKSTIAIDSRLFQVEFGLMLLAFYNDTW